jgi:hypothetical protein
MDDAPYQRDYLQIIGMLTAIGALLFGVVAASRAVSHGIPLSDRHGLMTGALLLTLVVGGAALARAHLWGGALLATTYLVVAFWFIHLAIREVHTTSTARLAGMLAAAALLMLPAALVLRWRSFLR